MLKGPLKHFATLLLCLGAALSAHAAQAGERTPTGDGSAALPPNVISWGTASELDSFGYDVYRGLSEEGPFAVVNAEVIPGAGTTDIPQRYEFVDDAIEPGTVYWYYVESISLAGERKRITPVYPSRAKSAPEGTQ